MARRRYERLTTPEPKKKIIRCVKVIQNTNIKYFEKNVEEFLASITPEYQINYQHEVAHDELHDKDTVYHFATITYNMEVDDNE